MKREVRVERTTIGGDEWSLSEYWNLEESDDRTPEDVLYSAAAERRALGKLRDGWEYRLSVTTSGYPHEQPTEDRPIARYVHRTEGVLNVRGGTWS